MEGLVFENINEAQLFFLKELLASGEEIDTRGTRTLELSPVFFSIANPLKRITTLRGRNWKFATALGELSWHLSVSNDVDFICNYLSGWKNFSNDQKQIIGSCYGKRIFERKNNGVSKWEEIISLLKSDLQSRRAVISLLDSDAKLNPFEVDISCTVSLQFLIRNGKLDLIVNMRSNDVIWGLPYDFFFFSFLQELMALELNLPVGFYYHLAGSLHIYDRHYEMAKKITTGDTSFLDLEMPRMKSNELEIFLSMESEIRSGKIDIDVIKRLQVDVYWKELLEVLYFYNNKKNPKMKNEEAEFISKNKYASVV